MTIFAQVYIDEDSPFGEVKSQKSKVKSQKSKVKNNN
jgi:hypothetical protein